ncbi:MAG: DedA family protein [Candidatus Kaiserbacteria bacterium]|nr:DedA family protein [Candidatus Kaiserbacteria bacterium]
MDLLSLPFVQQVVIFVESSKYILLFLGTLVEGPLMMLGSGLLYHLGQVTFWPVYLVLVFGDLTADVGWYIVGYWGARPFFDRYGHYLGLTPDVIEKVERRFNHFSDRILIISKLTMGFGLSLATLTIAGMLRVPFWRYAVINLFCGFIWTAFLFYIGYFFGNIYELVPGYLRIAFVICSLLAAFFGIRALNRHLARAEW